MIDRALADPTTKGDHPGRIHGDRPTCDVLRLAELVNARYQFESTAGPAAVPVRLYRLKEGPVASDKSSSPIEMN